MSTINERQTFSTWLYQHRLILFIVSFIIVIPTVFVVLFYSVTFSKYKSFYFDVQEEIITFTDASEMPINLNYELVSITNPSFDSNNVLLKNGNFNFRLSYSAKNSNVSNVEVVLLLHANWMDFRFSQKDYIYNSSRNLSVSYSTKLPQSPLLFVTINRPDFYIKVNITIKDKADVETYYIRDDGRINADVPVYDQ